MNNKFNKWEVIYVLILIITSILLKGYIAKISNNGIDFGLFLFGALFFIVGIAIASTGEKPSLIFLFSHGGVGLGFLLFDSIKQVIPILSDRPNNLFYYFSAALALLLTATLAIIIRCFSDKMKENKIYLLAIYTLYYLGITMITIMPNITNIIL